MFFSLSKILTFFIDPLVLILIFNLFCLFKLKRKKIPLLFFACFYLLSIPFISQRLLYLLENTEKTSSLKSKYDVVIVLSGMVDLRSSDSTVIHFSESVDRILAGIKLVTSQRAGTIIISGGDSDLMQTDRSEAVLLGAFAQQMGVHKQQILLDQSSRNTFENAVNTAKLIKQHKFSRILLITSAFHMIRARGCFKKQGLEVDILPVDLRSSLEIPDYRYFIPAAYALDESRLFFHELVGVIVYGITGKAVY